jgi:HPt (histidine-containing phosphotransfer) domain-containing protein
MRRVRCNHLGLETAILGRAIHKYGAIMNESASELETVINFEALEQRCLGNLGLMERVLAKFLNQLEADLLLLERAVEEGNAIDAAEIAHRMKGTAGSVEAPQLHRDAAQCEQAALLERHEELPELLRNIQFDRSELTAAIGDSGTERRPAVIHRR